jgi:hypothetical protein
VTNITQVNARTSARAMKILFIGRPEMSVDALGQAR